MIDRWFPTIKLPLTFKQFERLPRNPAYKYEYLDDKAWLSPRPKQYSALLELSPLEEVPVVDVQREPIRIRRFEPADWDALPEVFAASFSRVQPFASLSDKKRLAAARDCLRHTREEGDGPVIEPACCVAASERDGRLVGGLLATIMPDIPLTEYHCYRWKEPPPPDWLERKLGRPHLTWIFVTPFRAGHGVGTALLAATVRELLALGYHALASTFLLGNDSSTLWHWRNGFRLSAHPGSKRLWEERMRRTMQEPS